MPALAAIGDDPANAPLAGNELRTHHLLLQNDLIRIMRVLVPPGEATGWHEHNSDYVVAIVNGTKFRGEMRGDPNVLNAEMPTKALQFMKYEGKHVVHRIINTQSGALNHQIAFELVKPAASKFPLGDRSAAAQYKLELDNDRVRSWRLQLGPGENAGTITQKAPCVRFVFLGERIMETDAKGKAKELAVRAGDYAWMPDSASRTVTNAGNTPLEIVEIELK